MSKCQSRRHPVISALYKLSWDFDSEEVAKSGYEITFVTPSGRTCKQVVSDEFFITFFDFDKAGETEETLKGAATG